MGGGGVMRAVAKVAGMGAVSGGLRGGIAVPAPVEQSVMRGAKRPISSILTSQGPIGGVSADVASAQKGSYEVLDDWEFAGGVEEEMALTGSSGGEPMARLVFGGPPSVEEAKGATNDLKDALELYLSSPMSSSGSNSPFAAGPGQSLLSKSEHLETKNCIVCDPKADPVPKHAVQAFKLLSESPKIQSVVESLACDPNVWNSVFENDDLKEFLQSQKINAVSHSQESATAESPGKFEEFSEASKFENTGENFKKNGDAFNGFLENIKTTVVGVVQGVSGFFHNMWSSLDAEGRSTNAKENPESADHKTLGAYLISLAVLVIMVVVLKRV